ncbi:MAG: tRNA (guanosine(37)-N1)-methyltransferase TrmD [Pseudomonadota bacterium]
MGTASAVDSQDAGNAPWQATVLTLFPDVFPGVLGVSIAERGRTAGIWTLETLDIRGFARDKHRSVDDAPFGGGPGMVMRPDVVDAAVAAGVAGGKADRPLIYLSARGRPLNQQRVRELADGPGVILLCGRFEGIDERVIQARGAEEISVSDVVLSGGEAAAMVLLDACVRLLPGVIGQEASLDEESFENGLLEYPHYTRPADWNGHSVPEVLLSGHHDRVRQWREQESRRLTQERRPDLWQRFQAYGETQDET